MPKHEPMSAKAIGKKIKSKGLQKLKFYCQMCQKQCRDANGFKCHLTSEAHQRQLLLFAENPNRYLNDFSGEFMRDFLNLVKRRYSTKRVHANQVYQEYIKERDHLHMNATRWTTLTGFVKWMGRKGKVVWFYLSIKSNCQFCLGICNVEENEKGLFLTYIDRDPETLKRQEELDKKEKMAKDDCERQAKIINEQIERGKRLEEMKNAKKGVDAEKNGNEGCSEDEEDTKFAKQLFHKESEDQKITFQLPVKEPLKNRLKLGPSLSSTPFGLGTSKSIKVEEPDSDTKPIAFSFGKKEKTSSSGKRVTSALDDIIKEQEEWKAKKAKNGKAKLESWLVPGIVVRVTTKDLGPTYHNKKAVVEKIPEEFIGLVKMIDTGDLVKLDEAHLQTIVPRIGSQVMILRGLYRERKGTIVEVLEKIEKVAVKVDGSSSGKTIELSLDDVSKLA